MRLSSVDHWCAGSNGYLIMSLLRRSCTSTTIAWLYPSIVARVIHHDRFIATSNSEILQLTTYIAKICLIDSLYSTPPNNPGNPPPPLPIIHGSRPALYTTTLMPGFPSNTNSPVALSVVGITHLAAISSAANTTHEHRIQPFG